MPSSQEKRLLQTEAAPKGNAAFIDTDLWVSASTMSNNL